MTTKKTILIVDDEPVIADAIAREFMVKGFDVVVASDGITAIDNARKYNPALILLDLHIPKVGGLRICEILKDNVATADIPILVLSAVDSQDTKEAASKLGIKDFLVKPLKLEEVREKILGYFKEAK